VSGQKIDELAATIERHTGVDGQHATALSQLTLYRRSDPSAPTSGLHQPSLCLVAQGGKEVLLGDEVYRYGPAQFLLVSVDVPIMGQVTEASAEVPYLSLRIELDSAVVGELLADGVKGDTHSAHSARALVVSRLDNPLLDAVLRLVALMDTPRDVGALAPLILREITYRLLSGEQGPRLRQIATRGAPAQGIARAIRWLKEHYAELFRVEFLAREARMSPSAFHHHFKAVTAMSPLQYQKRLRLQEARRLMLGERLNASEAAFRVGYESASQFSREYRRMFGTPPRRDVAMLQPDFLP
jgi:AraC-like DNA-binding protein